MLISLNKSFKGIQDGGMAFVQEGQEEKGEQGRDYGAGGWGGWETLIVVVYFDKQML